jgi:hypothetical protein
VKIIDPGMLKTKYVVYTLTTPAKGFSVERRYSDFYALRQEMINAFSGYVISPLPAKRITGSVDPGFVQERKGELQVFLKELMKHSLFFNYDPLIDFLSLSSKEWQTRINQINKLLIPKEIEYFTTIEGQAKVLFTGDNKNYTYRLLPLAKDIKDCFTDLKAINKIIASDYERLRTPMLKAVQLYKRLGEVLHVLNARGYYELLTGIRRRV